MTLIILQRRRHKNWEAAWLSGQSWGFECGRPGFKSELGLLNGFVLGDTRGKFTTLCNSQLVCLLPVGILNWERGGF